MSFLLSLITDLHDNRKTPRLISDNPDLGFTQSEGRTSQSFVDAAVFPEEMGFRTVWFGNHIFPRFHSGKRSVAS
jgi:alkanesulfonate monooxygenase SsuD/methylene tetrahydromethanopterin reductase-like flavin-dependent oxidoreductase (luciferase family)